MKNIKKIAATDIDGTIIFEWNNISQLNKDLLLEFQKNSNNSLTLVTGRNYLLIDFLVQQLNIKLPVICSNGASIIDVNNFSYIFKNHFQENELKNILKQFKNSNIAIEIAGDFSIHYFKDDDDYLRFNNDLLTKRIKDHINSDLMFKYQDLDDLIENCSKNNETFPVIVAVIDDKDKQKLEFARKIAKENDLEILEFFEEINWRIELFKKNVTKSLGVRKLLEIFNLKNEDIFLFGDGHNDYPMFDDFENCYAVGNAIDGLKQRAKEVIDTVYDGGVGKKLNSMIEYFK